MPATFTARPQGKDPRLALAEGRRLGLDASAVEVLAGLVLETVERGSQDEDYSVVYEIIDPGQA
jgi:3-hydroxyisobutyrate dehydrogenase-like beta-hydroxyacid dehydrogenase